MKFIKDPMKQAEKLSDEIIIPNWFGIEEVEGVTGEEISVSDFIRFREWLKDTGLADEVSELVGEYYRAYKADIPPKEV